MVVLVGKRMPWLLQYLGTSSGVGITDLDVQFGRCGVVGHSWDKFLMLGAYLLDTYRSQR